LDAKALKHINALDLRMIPFRSGPVSRHTLVAIRVTHSSKGRPKMTIASRLKDYIDGKGISYDTVAHHRTSTTRQSAVAAHVPGSRMAKSVVVHHELGYALAVVPSTHRIELGRT
jgi:hypothetical protein